jgi:hypothetical protein
MTTEFPLLAALADQYFSDYVYGFGFRLYHWRTGDWLVDSLISLSCLIGDL